jgi:hypothetical protein
LLFAIVFALEKFRFYLIGSKVIVFKDIWLLSMSWPKVIQNLDIGRSPRCYNVDSFVPLPLGIVWTFVKTCTNKMFLYIWARNTA